MASTLTLFIVYGNFLEAMMYLGEANAYYREILQQIRKGGLNNWQRNKFLYDEIKHNHKSFTYNYQRERRDRQSKEFLSGKVNFISYLRYIWLQVDQYCFKKDIQLYVIFSIGFRSWKI